MGRRQKLSVKVNSIVQVFAEVFMEKTKRMKRLERRLFDVEYHNPGIWQFKDTNLLELYPEMTEEPLVVRKAMAQKYMGEHLTVEIKPDELIVGLPNQNSVGWGTVMPIYYTPEEGEYGRERQLNEASVWGHHPARWDKVIAIGTLGLKAEIEQAAAVHADNEEALIEYRAMLIALEGIEAFAKRFSDKAFQEAVKCEEPVRRQELLEISRVCAGAPFHGAKTFQEALQTYWFAYCLINSGGEYLPLGRADQILIPYYESDIGEGLISEEYAQDLMASFLVKCNEKIIIDTKKAENHYSFGLFSQGVDPEKQKEDCQTNQTGGYEVRLLSWQENEDINSDANFNYGQSGNDWLMNCMVGGVKPDGTDGTNALSYMIVSIMHELHLLMPTLGARVHKDTPQSFFELLAKVLRYGQGEPMIYNDDVIVPGFVEFGIPVEEARDYSNDGCWECLIPGKSYFTYAHVMNLRCIEWVLFRGQSLHNGRQEGLDTGRLDEFDDFESFYQAYMKQVANYIDNQCRRRIDSFGLSYVIAPDPLLSSMVDDCITKGKDMTQDGARYYFHQILITGFANTVDALYAIKELVFERGERSLEEIARILKNNWEGNEYLRYYVLNKIPKFGNDNAEVDEFGVRMLKDFEAIVDKWNKKEYPVKFPCGVGTFENYAALGRDMGASADGRYFGDPLAPNYSPQPGADINGPTAAIKSCTRPNLSKYFSGAPFDLSINSNDFKGEAGIGRLVSLIRSFCELEGQILTVTSLNVSDLKEAKVNPEKHRNLRVRMGGLSAYFIAMSPVQQDNIIKRFNR